MTLECNICCTSLLISYNRINCNKLCNEQYHVHEKCYQTWLKQKDECPHCHISNPTNSPNYSKFRTKFRNWARQYGVRTGLACSVLCFSAIAMRSVKSFGNRCVDQDYSCTIIANVAEQALIVLGSASGTVIGIGVQLFIRTLR